jgi:ribosomal-protein-alanine N-acetyltransferase
MRRAPARGKSAPVTFLETERLTFRAHEPRDEAPFVQMHTDPDVRRFAGGRPWAVDEATARFRAQYLHRPRGTYGLWAAILKAEDVYVGMCGLHGGGRSPHLAFYIARPHWGKGLATEAARAFLGDGFARLRLERILATADESNARSARILTTLGFREVRVETVGAGGSSVTTSTAGSTRPPPRRPPPQRIRRTRPTAVRRRQGLEQRLRASRLRGLILCSLPHNQRAKRESGKWMSVAITRVYVSRVSAPARIASMMRCRSCKSTATTSSTQS